jgi:hypothetical protein
MKKAKKHKVDWEDSFKQACEEHDGIFGHNIEIKKSEFRKLVKLGADISFSDYYSATIKLPKAKKARENILFYVIDLMPSARRLDSKKNKLYLEWHY